MDHGCHPGAALGFVQGQLPRRASVSQTDPVVG